MHINNIPHYILPAATLVLKTLWDKLSSLMVSWLYTMKITFGSLLVGGVAHQLFLCGLWVLMAGNCKTTWLRLHNMTNVIRANCDAFVSKVSTTLKAM